MCARQKIVVNKMKLKELKISITSIRQNIFFIFAILACIPSNAQINKHLDNLLDVPFLQKTQIGIMIYDLDADSMIYCKNEKQTLRPASTMKILVATAALDTLHANYTYRTELWRDGEVKEGILDGDLIVKGGFDPAFDSLDAKAFVDEVKTLGIDMIRGNVIFDVSFKDSIKWGKGWCWDDENYDLIPLCYNHEHKNIFADAFTQQLYTATEGAQWASRGKRELIAERIRPITEILTKMMKESDNLYAESMLFQLAHRMNGDRASADDGLEYIKDLVRKVGLNPDDYKFVDGSGLSLYNYVSAELLCRILRYAWQKQDIFNQIYHAMPIAGRDGTLQKRMHGTYAENNVHAKTGTVTGVSSLAGYCTARNGHTICFAIINQGVMQQSKAHALQDEICNTICKY